MNKLLSLTTALLASASLQAADLSTIYQQAASNDAEIAAARATREANGYNVTIARGALLPQASLNYSINQYDSELEAPSKLYKADYDTNTLQLQASMTLFNLNSWYSYQAAVTGDSAAGLELQLAEQQLLLRTAQAYFNVLRAG